MFLSPSQYVTPNTQNPQKVFIIPTPNAHVGSSLHFRAKVIQLQKQVQVLTFAFFHIEPYFL
jgi:hypothetical protein